jgi:DNA-binding response OmpR family regulator
VTPKEFELLVYLLQHKNQAVSREMLLEKVWDYHFIGGVRTVDTHIKMLRKNLRQYRDLIVTVRGTGYKLEH